VQYRPERRGAVHGVGAPLAASIHEIRRWAKREIEGNVIKRSARIGEDNYPPAPTIITWHDNMDDDGPADNG
jgi:hypothetical protein